MFAPFSFTAPSCTVLSILAYIGLGMLVLIHLCLWGTLLGNLAYLRAHSHSTTSDLPTLSVCIPARNEAENLRRLLPSLLHQRYPSFEIIVWDDESTDDTWEFLQSVDDPRLQAYQGSAPPSDWVGKVHALHQCTRRAEGDCYLFLDADAKLTSANALKQIVGQHQAAPTSVSSGFPRLRGGGQLLVSLVPYAMLTGLPWPLVRRTSLPAVSALNGQCWMVDAPVYHSVEPHAEHHNAVLEDVEIGRYFKRMGHPPTLLDVQDVVSIYMYPGLPEAWRGFRKNVYLLMGGTPGRFIGMFVYFVLIWVVSPIVSLWFLASLYGLKFLTDQMGGFSKTVTLLSPVSFVAGLTLQFDSAIHHWVDDVTWKGRSVPSSEISSHNNT